MGTLPCVERNDTDLPPLTKAPRPAFKHRSHYTESPAYLTLGHYRVVKLPALSLDAFFQSSVKDQLMYRYKTELLSQWPGEESAILVCEVGEDQSHYSVLPFNCLGSPQDLRISLQHALTRYQNVQKLDLIGCTGGQSGLYFLFRSSAYSKASPQIVELAVATTPLQLEAELNSLIAQGLSFRLGFSTAAALYVVLGQEAEEGCYIVLDLGKEELLARVSEELNKNAGNERMKLVGLVATAWSAMLVYLYKA